MRDRIAVIVAHIDDAEIWAGGTLLRHSKVADINIYVLNCNDECRKKEALISEDLLKAQYIYINRGDLYSNLCSFRPTIILTHWGQDSHPEHSVVFDYVQEVLPYLHIQENLSPNVYCMETYNWMGLYPWNIYDSVNYIDISDVWEKKIELIGIFKSQPTQYWQDMILRQNQLAGAQVGVKYAECFMQIPVLGVKRCSGKFLKGN